MDIGVNYLNIVKKRFMEIKKLGDQTFHQLDDEQLYWSNHEESNSIAVIIKHVGGNMVSRWSDFLSTDGEKSNRNRDLEFDDSYLPRKELIRIWEQGWQIVFNTLDDLTEQDLLKKVKIRGENHFVMAAIERQVSHYSYHVGQIVYIGKLLKTSEWQSLSIPRGKSNQFNKTMFEQHKN
ncbi:DUF1572 family protein [Viridibacillus sp. FSL R5-0477]|uniref:DUF1572 domain-containing protein n=1 Tax=Viridibacillus arenosi FSL R5-213 TaxID=1227360 RepID=W4F6K0_9BACL|nr:DUF1572 family protein [Viridibacillus arenosi]ETT87756.1 hypothetical protein C176_02398 [Viridibacillus arenosi FSL R5-213]OMC89776.1 hypothetical protein BK137_15360 [Viridibacillus arenosi]